MRRFSYDLLIGDTHHDITRIADSSSLSIISPLCSEDKKSGNGTASVNLKGGADPTFYQTFMQALLNAQQNRVLGDCLLTITDISTTKVVHRGFLNMDEFTIASGNFPDSLNLASRDKSTLLDTKIRYNRYWEGISRNSIVSELITAMNADNGVEVDYLSSELADTEKIGHLAVAEGREQTYREVIDTILFEAVGYVLWYDPDADGFRIKRIPTELDDDEDYRVVRFRVENRLTTQSSVYGNDGVLLSYPTITERANTNIYNEGINLSVADDGTVTGESVESNGYFPADGDVKEIYQQYSVPDRAFISGESRLNNEDLELLYAKDVTYSLASAPKMKLSPALPNVNWGGVAEFYPDRARLLFVNENTSPSNVTTLSLTGTAVYISAMNRITVPASCVNPEEYRVQTITDSAKAKTFADWYYNSQRYGCTTSRWSEPEGYSTLGEIVMVRHKDTGVEMPHVIVQITDSNAGGASGTIRLKEIVAISLYGWQSTLSQTVPQTTKPSVQRLDSAKWYSGTVLNGKTLSRGVAGNYGDYYLNTETGDVYRCTESGTAMTAVWQWVMNNKGSDASVDGIQYSMEYAMSTSAYEFTYPTEALGYSGGTIGAIDPDDDDDFEYGFQNMVGWGDNYSGWYRGLFVWERTKITFPDGTVTYSSPTYNSVLTQSLTDGSRFALVPKSPSWLKNLASSVDTSVAFDVIAENFQSDADARNAIAYITAQPFKGGIASGSAISIVPPTLASLTNVTFTFPKNSDWDSIIITATLQIKRSNVLIDSDSASCSFSAIDVTQYDVYANVHASEADAIAWFTTNCGGMSEGYSYVDSTDKVIKVWVVDGGVGGFEVLDTDNPKVSQILSQAERDYWVLYDTATQEQKDELWSLYGYKRSLIAEVIATAKLRMYGDGIISSADIDPDNPSLQNGFLTATGYHFRGSDGTLRATNAWIRNGHFNDVQIDGDNTQINGNISTPVFEVQREDQSSNTQYSATSPDATTGSADALIGKQVKDNLKAWASGGGINVSTPASPDVRNATGSLFGKTFDKIAYFGTSVSKTYWDFAVLHPSGADEEDTLTWTNPFPTKLWVLFSARPKTFYWEDTVTDYNWVKLYDANMSVLGDKEDYYDFPDNPSVGDVWLIWNSEPQWNENAQKWYGTLSLYEYQETGSHEESGENVGQMTLQVGSTIYSDFGGSMLDDVPIGASVTLTLSPPEEDYSHDQYYLEDGSADFSWKPSDNFKAGIALFNGSTVAYLNSQTDNVVAQGATLTVAGVEILYCPLSTTVAWRYGTGRGNVEKLFDFNWDSGHEPSASGNAMNFSSVSASMVASNGDISTPVVSSNINGISYNTASVNVDGTPAFSLSHGTYYKAYAISFVPIIRPKGVYSKNIVPYDTLDDYDLGTTDYYWNRAYINDIYSYGNLITSARKLKENIEDYKGDALAIVKDTKVCSFTYRKDRGKENVQRHYGFIADDTAEELATPDHNVMDMGSCIGILIKAVQELSAEVERLKGDDK